MPQLTQPSLRRFARYALYATLIASVLAALFVFELWRAAHPSIAKCVGQPLPDAAVVIASTGRENFFSGDRYFVVQMSELQFFQFAGSIGMKFRPDLFQYWSTGLAAPGGIEWTSTPPNDADTLYGEINGSLDIARWENGKMYLHVSTN